MLVLARKLNERLLIGEEIEIKVLGVSGSRVRLGIEAPDHMAIRRAELSLPVTPAGSTDTIQDGLVATPSIQA